MQAKVPELATLLVRWTLSDSFGLPGGGQDSDDDYKKAPEDDDDMSSHNSFDGPSMPQSKAQSRTVSHGAHMAINTDTPFGEPSDEEDDDDDDDNLSTITEVSAL